MSELICDMDKSLITKTRKCLTCDKTCKKVHPNFISCEHIRPSNDLSVNTVFNLSEEDMVALKTLPSPPTNPRDDRKSTGSRVRGPAETIETVHPQYDVSVWDKDRPIITSPVFSIPKKVELIKI